MKFNEFQTLKLRPFSNKFHFRAGGGAVENAQKDETELLFFIMNSKFLVLDARLEFIDLGKQNGTFVRWTSTPMV